VYVEPGPWKGKGWGKGKGLERALHQEERREEWRAADALAHGNVAGFVRHEQNAQARGGLARCQRQRQSLLCVVSLRAAQTSNAGSRAVRRSGNTASDAPRRIVLPPSTAPLLAPLCARRTCAMWRTLCTTSARAGRARARASSGRCTRRSAARSGGRQTPSRTGTSAIFDFAVSVSLQPPRLAQVAGFVRHEQNAQARGGLVLTLPAAAAAHVLTSDSLATTHRQRIRRG